MQWEVRAKARSQFGLVPIDSFGLENKNNGHTFPSAVVSSACPPASKQTLDEVRTNSRIDEVRTKHYVVQSDRFLCVWRAGER